MDLIRRMTPALLLFTGACKDVEEHDHDHDNDRTFG